MSEKVQRLYNRDGPFYQWDTGRKLILNDSECAQVHFSNENLECALACQIYVQDGVRMVNVPNILLQEAKPIKVYLNMVDSDGRLTSYSEILPVVKRKKPEEYIYTETEVLNYAYLDKRLADLEGDGLANAVAKYLRENPISAGSTATIGYVELLAKNWVTESEEKHSQVVSIYGVTKNSQVDLTPTEEQLIIWRNKELAFTTKNSGGVVTVYAIGQKPENDYTIQVTITEVGE